MALNITITDVGRAELINAQNTGTGPVTVAEIGFGSGQYTPLETRTALQAEHTRINTIAGEVVADDTIHVTVKDESNTAYNVGEFGLFSASGTLLAVYSQTGDWIIEKSAVSTLLLGVDIILESLDASTLTFGDVSFSNPPASETVKGVAEIATQAETDTGTDDTRIVSPKKLKAHLGKSYLSKAEAGTYAPLPEILTNTGKLAITDNGDNTYTVDVNQTLRFWGFQDFNTSDYSLADRTFTVPAGELRHVRFVPAESNPFQVFNLQDLAYNPSGLTELDPAFDTARDNMIIGKIENGTYYPCINKNDRRSYVEPTGTGVLLLPIAYRDRSFRLLVTTRNTTLNGNALIPDCAGYFHTFVYRKEGDSTTYVSGIQWRVGSCSITTNNTPGEIAISTVSGSIMGSEVYIQVFQSEYSVGVNSDEQLHAMGIKNLTDTELQQGIPVNFTDLETASFMLEVF